MFNMPNAEITYNLINKLVKNEQPLSISLILDKFVNKFVTGYAGREKWEEGKQSEIKRQLYLINKKRIDVMEELWKVNSTKLKKIIKLLGECDVESAIKELKKMLRNIKDENLKSLIDRVRSELLNIKLSIPISCIDKSLCNSYHKRIRLLCQDLRERGYEVIDEELGLKWRLAINLGAASVYETSVLLHRNYSIPYIPGSAIKGVTRHWAILKLFNQYYKKHEGKVEEICCIEKIVENLSEKDISYEEFKEKFAAKLREGSTVRSIKPSRQLYEFFKENYEEIKIVRDIFGTQNRKGMVVFFDAIPVMEGIEDFMVLDVMNVHYRPYYDRGKIPGDWHNPEPVFFLAIESGVRFRFVLASKKKILAIKAKELLMEALENIGIGAKTSVGYGYFEV